MSANNAKQKTVQPAKPGKAPFKRPVEDTAAPQQAGPARGEPLAGLTAPPASAETVADHAAIVQRAQTGVRGQAGAALRQLQRQYGNHYVQRVVSQAKTGGGPRQPIIQPKLMVGPIGDTYEREADRVAGLIDGQAGPASAPPVSRRPDSAPPMQRQAGSGPHGGPVDSSIETGILRARGGGHSLDSNLRETIEPVLQADFSDVRIHTGAEADQLNRALGARAFTTGRDVFFKKGEYRPAALSGRKLIAHELTHVVQQTGQGAPYESVQRVPDEDDESTEEFRYPSLKEQYDKTKRETGGDALKTYSKASDVHGAVQSGRRFDRLRETGSLGAEFKEKDQSIQRDISVPALGGLRDLIKKLKNGVTDAIAGVIDGIVSWFKRYPFLPVIPAIISAVFSYRETMRNRDILKLKENDPQPGLREAYQHGVKKLDRKLNRVIFRLVKGVSQFLARLITVLTGGAAAIVSESIDLCFAIAGGLESAYRAFKGFYKFFKKSKGKHRFESAETILNAAMAGDAGAQEVVITLLRTLKTGVKAAVKRALSSKFNYLISVEGNQVVPVDLGEEPMDYHKESNALGEQPKNLVQNELKNLKKHKPETFESIKHELAGKLKSY